MKPHRPPITDRRIRFAVVGCGRISDNHLRALTSPAVEAELVAVADVEESRARAKAEQYGVPCYGDVHRMLARHPDIDVIEILTPTGYHARHVVELARYGKHFVVEKPMALRVPDCDEMLAACGRVFADCDGLIAVAAPCDYRPVKVEPQKIHKTGEPLVLHLVETPDIVASLAAGRTRQWIVGFALETQDHRLRALAKLERKSCDLVVVNGVAAIDAWETHVEVLDRAGQLSQAPVEAPGPKVRLVGCAAVAVSATLTTRSARSGCAVSRNTAALTSTHKSDVKPSTRSPPAL